MLATLSGWEAGQIALEYLDSSSVGDLFFVHQPGFHLARPGHCYLPGCARARLRLSFPIHYDLHECMCLLFFLGSEFTYNLSRRFIPLLSGMTLSDYRNSLKGLSIL